VIESADQARNLQQEVRIVVGVVELCLSQMDP